MSEKVGAAKEWWDKFIIKAPLFGELVQRIQIGQFVRTLAIMMNNHVPILPAIKISIKVIGNNEIAASFASVGDELRGWYEAFGDFVAKFIHAARQYSDVTNSRRVGRYRGNAYQNCGRV